MATYKVTLCETFYNYTVYEVEANDTGEAEEFALEERGVVCDTFSKDAGITDVIQIELVTDD